METFKVIIMFASVVALGLLGGNDPEIPSLIKLDEPNDLWDALWGGS